MAQWTENAKIVLASRYLIKDEKGDVIETPDNMLVRVASFISKAEKPRQQGFWQDKFFTIMDDLEFLPNSPTLMNAGRELGNLSACLAGDTVIHTLAGDFTIKELADKYKDKQEERFEVYSATNFSRLGIDKAFAPRLARKNAPLYKIMFDDGSHIKATSDHLIMCRNGRYCRVDELKIGQSVMPFNHDYNHGYLIVFKGIDKYPIPAHKFVYEQISNSKLKSNEVIHHVDFTKSNNSFVNLKKMDKIEHFLWHSKNSSGDNNPMRRFPELRERASEIMKNGKASRIGKLGGWPKGKPNYKISGFRIERVEKICPICGSKFIVPITSKKVTCGNKSCSNKLSYINGRISGWKGSNNPNHGSSRFSGIPWWAQDMESKNKVIMKLKQPRKSLYNHKVVSIEFYGNEDVYDLSTEKYHNFAANNVFVHNCYLIEVEDDLAAILEAVKRAALIHKTGGGTGIVFSKLRPSNSMVGTTKGVASGPVSFMKIFDTATEVVKQGGVRRGANLGTLIVTHPDIFEFISCKDKIGEFVNFNISVAITDSFIKSLKNGHKFTLKFRGEPYIQVDSRALFKRLCQSAHKTGDPGLLFIDTANRFNPMPQYGPYMGTNPCGEQWLQAWSSCNLGSIDVSKFVKGTEFNWEHLKEVVDTSVRFLDNVITVNKFPNVKIKHKTNLLRPVGLGIMGWADALLRLNVKYDSDEALNLADGLMKFINNESHEESKKIGQEKGYCDDKLKMRNSSLTCIAPTGTLSMLADCSSSIEPIFDKKVSKAVLNGYKLDISSKYADSSAFITARDVAPERHVKMQAAFQAHIDNAVSKTINLPEETTSAQIEEIFLKAWELGCKGITVFREGCRAGVIESTLDDVIMTPDCKSGKCNL